MRGEIPAFADVLGVPGQFEETSVSLFLFISFSRKLMN